jgi:hypothetical protein
MNATEEIKNQVAHALALGEERVKDTKRHVAYFQIGLGLILALGAIVLLTYTHRGSNVVTLIFGIIPLIQGYKTLNRLKTEQSRPAKPTPPGTSAAEQPRVPGSGAG